MYFERDRVPGMYCTTGKALCKDLNQNKICKCSQCEVWQEYNLKDGDPEIKFCKNGSHK